MKNIFKSFFFKIYKNIEIKKHELHYLFLEITKKCNLNCIHCGSDCRSDISSGELTTKSWLRIIDYICKHYGRNLTFVITGGEPLVHKDIFKIGNYIKKKGVRWGIVTNGLILDRNKLHQLIDSGLYSITISLDGLKKSHNKLRNNTNSFDRAINAIELSTSSDIIMRDVVTCVYPENLNQLDNVAELLLEKNISEWRLFRIFPIGRAAVNSETQLTFKQTWDMINWIKNRRKFYRKKGLNINLSCEGWLPFEIDNKVRDSPFFCRSGINFAAIMSDGTITGCTNNDDSFHQGNILEDNFTEIWENQFLNYRDRSWIENTNCSFCEYKNKCQGGSIHLWNLKNNWCYFCYMKENIGYKINKSI